MSAIFLVLSSLFIFNAQAATYEVPVTADDKILVRGLDAQVQFVGQPSNTLKVTGVEEGGEGNFVVSKRNGVIEIRMLEVSGKKNWLALISRPVATMKKIEIVGMSLPAEVQLRGGSVSAQKWQRDIKASMTQGRLSFMGNQGGIQASLQKGDAVIQDHNGRVKADIYSGNLNVVNLQGDAELNVFSGLLNVEKMRGNLISTTQQANAKVNASSGSLQFENGKGSLNILSFQGRMEGQNQEGAVSVTMALDSELDVRSKAGRVAVQTPANSGMSLNLLTNEGDIVVPAPLRVTRLSAERSVRGKLRGDAQRGSVFVRSQEGTISVK